MEKSIRYSLAEVALIIGIVFFTNICALNAEEVTAAEIKARELKKGGATAVEVAQVLEEKFNLVGREAEKILYAVCYDEEEYLDLTAFETVKRLAPVLKFDQAYKGLPMSADTYFKLVMHPVFRPTNSIWWEAPYYGPRPCDKNRGLIPLPGRDDYDPPRCGMSNNDFEKLTMGQVPTYFRVISDIATVNEGRLRIAYWWFYGWQPPCNDPGLGDDGAHHGDWEHIMVTTSPDRLKADFVTYYFHDAHYTRKNFELEGDRPVVYVGKLGHGSYHSNEGPSCWMISDPHHCCEYADCRNPTKNTKWQTVKKLISLHRNSESWMSADRIGTTYEIDEIIKESFPGIGIEEIFIRNWRWGPPHAYCHFGRPACLDWGFNYGVSTHPTVKKLDWTMSSCGDVGCGTWHCKWLAYTHKADFNQPWPSKLNMEKRDRKCGPVSAPSSLKVISE